MTYDSSHSQTWRSFQISVKKKKKLLMTSDLVIESTWLMCVTKEESLSFTAPYFWWILYLEEAAGFTNMKRRVSAKSVANVDGTGKWVIISFPPCSSSSQRVHLQNSASILQRHGLQEKDQIKKIKKLGLAHNQTRRAYLMQFPVHFFFHFMTSQYKLTALMFKTVHFIVGLNPHEIPIR